MRKTLQHDITAKSLRFIEAGYESGESGRFWGSSARDYNIVHFVVRGKGNCYLRGGHFTVHGGQCFYVPRNESAFCSTDADDPWTHMWVCFGGDDAAGVLEHCGFSSKEPVLTFSGVDLVYRLIMQMLSHSAPSPANDMFIMGNLLKVLSVIERDGHAVLALGDRNDNELVAKAVLHIQRHIGEALTVGDIASSLFISREYLFLLFKRHLHITPQQFMIAARMEHAGELLTKTDKPVHDIAAVCGYTNPLSFSRAFKRHFDVPPSTFRRMGAGATDWFDGR